MKPFLANMGVLCVVLSGLQAQANWPEFRGPTGQGLVNGKAGYPDQWSSTKNVAWKKAIPGSGWSSPIVVKDRIYLTAAVPLEKEKDLSLRTLCLDAKTGAVLWNKQVFKQEGAKSPGIHSKNSHASPTPILVGDRLYVHFGHKGTACLDLAGKVLWTNTKLTYAPVHGNGGSPVVVDGTLIFSCDGSDKRFLVALNCADGKEKWRTKRSENAGRGFSFSTPLAITVKGKKQIVSPGSDMVAGYDPVSGKEIWKVRYEGYSVIPRPVYGQGLLFIGTGYDSPELLAIRPDGTGDVTDTHVKWRLRKGAPHTPSPLLIGDELYLISDGGIASCLDAKTGEQHWQQRLTGGFSASPIAAGGKIYFLNETGSCFVVRAAKKYERLAKNDLKEKTLASIGADGGALFIRTDQHVYKIK
jgi:outer membrane protein assembly factor BamB